MLVLSRERDESFLIGDSILVTVVEIRRDKVRIGIDAPPDIPVHRQEVYDAIRDRGQDLRFAARDHVLLPLSREMAATLLEMMEFELTVKPNAKVLSEVATACKTALGM